MSRNQDWREVSSTWARAASHALASIHLTIPLIVSLAVALGWAATLATRHSPAHARWYVYESWWFIALLTLLAINRLCDAIRRLPWRRQHIGFIIANAGLLSILAGALWSVTHGIQGHITLAAGQTAQELIQTDHSQITAFWVGRPKEPPFEFAFNPGPLDWSDRKTLDLGRIDGVQARLLAFLQRPRPLETWIPDASHRGGPVVKFKVLGPDGKQASEGYLSDQQFGDAVAVGPIRLQLERAITDRMAADFLKPALGNLGEKGLLAIYHEDIAHHASIDQALGQEISLGETGATVQVAEYLPNAIPDRLGKFTSKGEHPKNPMLELRVHIPGQNDPQRQIAFAKDPLLNLDGVFPTVCPVKFRFHHPAVKRQTAVELMQDRGGRLLARLYESGTYTPHGELHVGDRLAIPGNFQLEIVEHIAHAVSQLSFVNDDSNITAKDQSQIEPAALIEISSGNATSPAWLRRNDPTYGQSVIAIPGGSMALKFEPAKFPFGFSLTLIDFQEQAADKRLTFSSNVRIVDLQHRIDQVRSITRKQPLMHRGYSFYPSISQASPHVTTSATFTVTYDPGLPLKYVGGLLLLLGIVTTCLWRYFAVRLGKSASFKTMRLCDSKIARHTTAGSCSSPPCYEKLPQILSQMASQEDGEAH